MKPILRGDWLSDHKARMAYRVIEDKQVDGKTVIIGEAHTTQRSPVAGYDVIILNHDGTIPDSESWGEKAWSWGTIEQATKAYREIREISIGKTQRPA